MPAGDPIRLGSALSGLIPDANSRISTDEYGVQRGTINYYLGDQSNAQSSRFTLGASYAGTLSQFNGFLVNRSGDIAGAEGQTAQINVEYVRIDPKWINIPLDSADLELKQIKVQDTSGFGTLYDSLLTVVIPILHPTVSYKYANATAKQDLGTYGTPTGAPNIREQVFSLNIVGLDNTSIDIEQKTISISTTLLTFHADGTCTKSSVATTSTFTGIFTQGAASVVNPLDIHFVPDPRGWLCIKQDQKPLAAGALYEIDETWKTNLVFSGTSPGSWWNGSHTVHCT